MEIFWKEHAKERFWERALLFGLNFAEAELALKKQKVKIFEGFDKKYKTNKYAFIEKFNNCFITFMKAESRKIIYVITLRESSEKEEKIWRKKQ